MTMPSNKWEEAVDKILLKLQVRASMKPSESDLEEAKQAINRLIAKASIRELQNTMPHTDGMRHYNTVVKRILELEQSLKEQN